MRPAIVSKLRKFEDDGTGSGTAIKVAVQRKDVRITELLLSDMLVVKALRVEDRVHIYIKRRPYAARLNMLIDSVAIALVRAQMDLVDTYVIVCVKGHVRPPFARGQRVLRPPAAGLHAWSSTVSDEDAGLQ